MSAEIVLDRRDLLFPFAKKRVTSKKPSQTHKTGSRLAQSQPPGRGTGGISRRQMILDGLALTAGVATGILRP